MNTNVAAYYSSDSLDLFDEDNTEEFDEFDYSYDIPDEWEEGGFQKTLNQKRSRVWK